MQSDKAKALAPGLLSEIAKRFIEALRLLFIEQRAVTGRGKHYHFVEPSFEETSFGFLIATHGQIKHFSLYSIDALGLRACVKRRKIRH